MISAVHPLLAEDLVRVLTEPKNALVKQYKKFFAYDDVELVFTRGRAHRRRGGRHLARDRARGLRSIIENALLDVMFELPGREDVTKCVVTRDTIERGTPPDAAHRGWRPQRRGRGRRQRLSLCGARRGGPEVPIPRDPRASTRAACTCGGPAPAPQ